LISIDNSCDNSKLLSNDDVVDTKKKKLRKIYVVCNIYFLYLFGII